MRKFILHLALLFAATPVLIFAQDNTSKPASTPGHFYKLVYVFQEVSDSGKVTNSRTYMTNVQVGLDGVQIRAGNRVPMGTGPSGDFSQWQYVDMGVNVDSRRAEEIDGKLGLQVTAESNDFAPPTKEVPHPVIRQNKWSATVLVPIGKPVVIFSSDDLNSKDKIQVELTATRID